MIEPNAVQTLTLGHTIYIQRAIHSICCHIGDNGNHRPTIYSDHQDCRRDYKRRTLYINTDTGQTKPKQQNNLPHAHRQRWIFAVITLTMRKAHLNQ